MSEQEKTEKVDMVRLVKHSAVGWFNLRMLIGTALQALLTSATGSRTTRREVLAALDTVPGNPHRGYDVSPQDGGDIWVDYVADLGDGFNATHAIAWLLGRDYIGVNENRTPTPQPYPADCMTEVPKDGFGDNLVLPGGSVTIFGGDLVYPYASKQLYEERTIGPYHAARPWIKRDDDSARRMLFSIPGNHDWYDGLGNFVHKFCQPGRWMGAWEVQQRRSYFALRLGHGFSLWGIDLATNNDFDAAQLEYFTHHAKALKENEQVILCVPAPAWNDLTDKPQDRDDAGAKDGDAWGAINLLINKITNSDKRKLNPARVAVMISGDLHHYARHEVSDGTQFITCGGGGAFALGTDAVPEKLYVTDQETVTEPIVFPSKDESRQMRRGVFSMFYRHKIFCATLAGIMLAWVWLVQSASETNIFAVSNQGLFAALSAIGTTLIHAPLLLVMTLGVFVGFIGFAGSTGGKDAKPWAGRVAGTLHFLAQAAIAFGAILFMLKLLAPLELGLAGYTLFLPPLVLCLSWPISGLTFSLYLWLSNILLGLHKQEIYSSQSIEGWKCFLRMHISAKKLTIYPIGLRRVAYDWEPSEDTTRPSGIFARAMNKLTGKPQTFSVHKGTTNLLRPKTPLEPHLIEKPIEIKRQGTAV